MTCHLSAVKDRKDPTAMLNNPARTTEALVDWIIDIFAGAGPACRAVVGISGGKDSSTVAALCARALGPDRVLGVLMPQGVQPDIDDARLLVQTLGIPSAVINVGPAVDALLGELADSAELAGQVRQAGQTGRAPEQKIPVPSADARINTPARIRMATLYAVAQSLPDGGRVANTCNMSEDYVGYATKYGDGAGDFSPLAQLVVGEVLQIARELGLPRRLVDKTPADGLTGLSDEEKLGFSYATLDAYIRDGVEPDPATKARIDRLHAANLHKLQPIPSFSPEEGSWQ